MSVGLFALAMPSLVIGLTMTLGESDDAATKFSIWGYTNPFDSQGWHEAAGATDIMNYTGLLLVAALLLAFAAAVWAFFRRPAEAAILGLASFVATLLAVMLYSIGIRDYTSVPHEDHPALGLYIRTAWYLLLPALPVLVAGALLAWRASWPIPPPPRPAGLKPQFFMPKRTIRVNPKGMRILPDYTPTPRQPKEEPSLDGTEEPKAGT